MSLTPVRVWVDTDVALGARRGDVDDGFALAAILAAARGGVAEIAGLSTVFGNTSAAEAQRSARALCETAGVACAIAPGAEEPGRGSAASEARFLSILDQQSFTPETVFGENGAS